MSWVGAPSSSSGRGGFSFGNSNTPSSSLFGGRGGRGGGGPFRGMPPSSSLGVPGRGGFGGGFGSGFGSGTMSTPNTSGGLFGNANSTTASTTGGGIFSTATPVSTNPFGGATRGGLGSFGSFGRGGFGSGPQASPDTPTAASLLDAAETVATQHVQLEVLDASHEREAVDDVIRDKLVGVVEALRDVEKAQRAPGWGGFMMSVRAEQLRSRLRRIEDELWLRISERGLHLLAVRGRTPGQVAITTGASGSVANGPSGLADLVSEGSSSDSQPPQQSSIAPAAAPESSILAAASASEEATQAEKALKERRRQQGLFEPTADDISKQVGASLLALSKMTPKSTAFNGLASRRLRVLQRVHEALASQRKRCRLAHQEWRNKSSGKEAITKPTPSVSASTVPFVVIVSTSTFGTVIRSLLDSSASIELALTNMIDLLKDTAKRQELNPRTARWLVDIEASWGGVANLITQTGTPQSKFAVVTAVLGQLSGFLVSFQVAASALSPGESPPADANFVVMLANRIFMPLIRALRGNDRLQVLQLLAEHHCRNPLVGLASEPSEWGKEFESWLWDIISEQPEEDELALNTRNLAATVLMSHLIARESLEDIIALVRLFVLSTSSLNYKVGISTFLRAWADQNTNDRRVAMAWSTFDSGSAARRNSSMVYKDGYLYYHSKKGLFKVGTGHQGTILGHIYANRPKYRSEKGWLAIHGNKLFYRSRSITPAAFIIIDTETLNEIGQVHSLAHSPIAAVPSLQAMTEADRSSDKSQDQPKQLTSTIPNKESDNDKIQTITVSDPEKLLIPERAVLTGRDSRFRSPIFSDGRYLYLLVKQPSQRSEVPEEEANKDAAQVPLASNDKVGEATSEQTKSSISEEPAPTQSATEVATPALSAQHQSLEAISTTTSTTSSPSLIGGIAASETPQAQPQASSGTSTSSSSSATTIQSEDYRIYMGEIPREYDEERVRELLVPFGPLRYLQLPRDRGWAIFEYRVGNPEVISRVCDALNGFPLEDKTLIVMRVVDRPPGAPEAIFNAPPPVAAEPEPTPSRSSFSFSSFASRPAQTGFSTSATSPSSTSSFATFGAATAGNPFGLPVSESSTASSFSSSSGGSGSSAPSSSSSSSPFGTPSSGPLNFNFFPSSTDTGGLGAGGGLKKASDPKNVSPLEKALREAEDKFIVHVFDPSLSDFPHVRSITLKAPAFGRRALYKLNEIKGTTTKTFKPVPQPEWPGCVSHCITAMPEYANTSFEELRYSQYKPVEEAPPFTLIKRLLSDAHYFTDGTRLIVAAPLDGKSTLCRVFSLLDGAHERDFVTDNKALHFRSGYTCDDYLLAPEGTDCLLPALQKIAKESNSSAAATDSSGPTHTQNQTTEIQPTPDATAAPSGEHSKGKQVEDTVHDDEGQKGDANKPSAVDSLETLGSHEAGLLVISRLAVMMHNGGLGDTFQSIAADSDSSSNQSPFKTTKKSLQDLATIIEHLGKAIFSEDASESKTPSSSLVDATLLLNCLRLLGRCVEQAASKHTTMAISSSDEVLLSIKTYLLRLINMDAAALSASAASAYKQRIFEIVRLLQQESGSVLVKGLPLLFPSRKDQLSLYRSLLNNHVALLKASMSDPVTVSSSDGQDTLWYQLADSFTKHHVVPLWLYEELHARAATESESSSENDESQAKKTEEKKVSPSDQTITALTSQVEELVRLLSQTVELELQTQIRTGITTVFGPTSDSGMSAAMQQLAFLQKSFLSLAARAETKVNESASLLKSSPSPEKEEQHGRRVKLSRFYSDLVLRYARVMLGSTAVILRGPLFNKLKEQKAAAAAAAAAAATSASAPAPSSSGVPSLISTGLALMDAANSDIGDSSTAPSPASMLRSSFIGTLLPTLITSLGKLTRNPDFVSTLLPELVPLIQQIDQLNRVLDHSEEGEKFYLATTTTEFVLRTLSSLHWALDLEKALAELIGQSISTLIQGGAISTDETSCQKWLDSKLLSSGFDDVPTGLEIYKKEFLDELVNTPATDTESEARTLATYMHRHITAKKPLSCIGGEIVAKVERAAVAALLKHNQLVNEAMTFAHWLVTNPTALEVAEGKAPLPPSLQMVWEVAYEVRAWLVQQQHKHRLDNKENESELSATNVYETVCAPVLKRIEFLLTVCVPEPTPEQSHAELAPEERERLSRSSSSMLAKGPSAAERKILKSSVESTVTATTPRILRARSTGTLKRSKPRGGGDSSGILEGDEAIASPTERRRQLLERKDTNENQRRVLESFKMWKLFRDRSKEAQPTSTADPAQDSVVSDAVVSFIMDDKLTPDGLTKAMQQRETRAQGRIYGLKTMSDLAMQINLRSVQFDLLNALLHGIKGHTQSAEHSAVALEKHHYMHLVSGCKSTTRQELTKAFHSLYAQLASLLRAKETETSVKVLLIQLWVLGFREEDHEFLQKVGILAILKKLASEDGSNLSSSQEGNSKGSEPKPQSTEPAKSIFGSRESLEQANLKQISKAANLAFTSLALYCVGLQQDLADNNNNDDDVRDRARLIERVVAAKAAAAASSRLKSSELPSDAKLPSLSELQKRIMELIFNELSTSLRVFKAQPTAGKSADDDTSRFSEPGQRAREDPFAYAGAQPGATWHDLPIPADRWAEYHQTEKRCLQMIKLLHPLTHSVAVLRYIAENSHNMQTLLQLVLVATPRIQRIGLRMLRDVVPMVRPDRLDYFWRLVVEETYPSTPSALATADTMLSFFLNVIGTALCNVCPVTSVDSAQTTASALAYLNKYYPEVFDTKSDTATSTPTKLRVSFSGEVAGKDAQPTPLPMPTFSIGAPTSPTPKPSSGGLLSALDELSAGTARSGRSPRRGKRNSALAAAGSLLFADNSQPASSSGFASISLPATAPLQLSLGPEGSAGSPSAASQLIPTPQLVSLSSAPSSVTDASATESRTATSPPAVSPISLPALAVGPPAFGSNTAIGGNSPSVTTSGSNSGQASVAALSGPLSFGPSTATSVNSPTPSGFSGLPSFPPTPFSTSVPTGTSLSGLPSLSFGGISGATTSSSSSSSTSTFGSTFGSTSTQATFSFGSSPGTNAASATAPPASSNSTTSSFSFGGSALTFGLSSIPSATVSLPAGLVRASQAVPWRRKTSIEKRVSQRAAMALASEVIALLRHLLDISALWRDKLREVLMRSLLDIPVLLRHEPKEPQLIKRVWHGLAALAIAGGFPEPLRIGGCVELVTTVQASGDSKKISLAAAAASAKEDATPTYHRGSIVGLDHQSRKAKVIYHDCTKRIVHSLDLDGLRAVPEKILSPSVLSLQSSVGLLGVFLFFLQTRYEQPTQDSSGDLCQSSLRSWDAIYAQMKSCSMLALASLLTDTSSVSLFVEKGGLQTILDLALKAPDFGPVNREELCEAQRERLYAIAHRAWHDCVPFSPYCNVPIPVPTAWDGQQLRYMQFAESDDAQQLIDTRTVDAAVRPGTVSAACADVPTSKFFPIFYFEVLLSGCGGSHIEVGLSPMKSSVSDTTTSSSSAACPPRCDFDSSYVYRGDGTKSGLDKNVQPFGFSFGSGDVVGCGWHREKRTIFFTNNGRLIDDAFVLDENQALSEFYPVVYTRSSGARITANFGHQAFAFNLYKYMASNLPDGAEHAPIPSPSETVTVNRFALEQATAPQATPKEARDSAADVRPPAPSPKEDEVEEEEGASETSKPATTETALPPDSAETQQALSAEVSSSSAATAESASPASPLQPAQSTSTPPATSVSPAAAALGITFSFGESSGSSGAGTAPQAKQRLTTVKRGRMGEIQEGSWYKVLKDPSSLSSDWTPAMNKTIGQIGLVLACEPIGSKVLVELYDQEKSLSQEWWYQQRFLKRPVKTVHDPWPHVRKQGLSQLQGLLADNETALLRKYAGQALLSLLAHWPQAMRLSLESIGDHSLLAFLKYVGVEYFCTGGVTTSLDPPAVQDSSMIECKGGLEAYSVLPSAPKPGRDAVIRVVSFELASRLKQESEQSVLPSGSLTSGLLDYCKDSGFWLANSADGKAVQSGTPDFSFATWLIALVYKNCSAKVKEQYSPKLFEELANYVRNEDNPLPMRVKVIRFMRALVIDSIASLRSPAARLRARPSRDTTDWLTAKGHGLHAELDGNLNPNDEDEVAKKRFFAAMAEFLVVLRQAKWDYFEYDEEKEKQVLSKEEESDKGKEKDEEDPASLVPDEEMDGGDSWLTTQVMLHSMAEWWLPEQDDKPRVPSRPLLSTATMETAFVECRETESHPATDTAIEKETHESDQKQLDGTFIRRVHIPDAKSLIVRLDHRSKLADGERLCFYLPRSDDPTKIGDEVHIQPYRNGPEGQYLQVEGDTIFYRLVRALPTLPAFTLSAPTLNFNFGNSTTSGSASTATAASSAPASVAGPFSFSFAPSPAPGLSLTSTSTDPAPVQPAVPTQSLPQASSEPPSQSATPEDKKPEAEPEKPLPWGYRFHVVPIFERDNAVRKQKLQSPQGCSHYARLRRELQGGAKGYAIDAEIVEYMNRLRSERSYSCVGIDIFRLQLSDTERLMYPRLAEISELEFNVRLLILTRFNVILSNTLPYLDFIGVESPHKRGTLAANLSRMRPIIFSEMKIKFFKAYYKATANRSGGTTVNVNRLLLSDADRENEKRKAKEARASRSDPFADEDDKDMQWNTFTQLFYQLHDTDPAQLRVNGRAFRVNLVGEGATDSGGPYRECLSAISADLQSNHLPLFIPCPNAQLALEDVGIGKNRDKYIPKPSSQSALHLAMYEFIGKLMGIAIRSKTPLPMDLPSVVWKPLVGLPLTTDDLRDIDQFCGQCLTQLQHPEAYDLNAENFSMIIFENFITTLSDGSKVELKEGGRDLDVTYENRLEYVELVRARRLAESRAQVAAMRRGLGAIIPLDALALFTWEELEVLVCGKATVDVNSLKQYARYDGYRPEEPTITMLWETLAEFSPKERGLFLRFVSGRERLTANKSQNAFTIARLHGSTEALPQSATCFFTLKLPAYPSREVLKQKLLLAITNCASIDTDFQVRQ